MSVFEALRDPHVAATAATIIVMIAGGGFLAGLVRAIAATLEEFDGRIERVERRTGIQPEPSRATYDRATDQEELNALVQALEEDQP